MIVVDSVRELDVTGPVWLLKVHAVRNLREEEIRRGKWWCECTSRARSQKAKSLCNWCLFQFSPKIKRERHCLETHPRKQTLRRDDKIEPSASSSHAPDWLKYTSDFCSYLSSERATEAYYKSIYVCVYTRARTRRVSFFWCRTFLFFFCRWGASIFLVDFNLIVMLAD